MKKLLFLLLLFLSTSTFAQRDYHWVFGDSVGLNFNTNPPTVDTNRIIMSLESSASISDNNGNLLFYTGSYTANDLVNHNYFIRSFNDSIMFGSDTLLGNTTITQGLLVIPFPYDSSNYYVFHIMPNLYYSIIDISLNNGLGEVISKNIFLKNGISEKLHAVKAANGEDWWIVGLCYISNLAYIYKYKIDSIGIHYKGEQYIGITPFASGAGQMIFSMNGDKIIFTGTFSESRIFSFDRCTGDISNEVFICPGICNYGASFSVSGRYAYMSSCSDSLFQFDLLAPNIPASQLLIYADTNSFYTLGQHMLAPDGKIYIANSGSTLNYVVDSLSTHLSVIEFPDSVGINCNFQPFYFSLNNRKCLGGLPNMVNYNLGKLENVNCDSILAASVSEINIFNFTLHPNPTSEFIYITIPEDLKATASISVFNITGQLMLHQPYKEKTSLSSIPNGMYLLKVETRQGVAFRKFIIGD